MQEREQSENHDSNEMRNDFEQTRFETSENIFFHCYSLMIGSYLFCEVSQFIVKLFEQKIRPWYIFQDWILSEKEFI